MKSLLYKTISTSLPIYLYNLLSINIYGSVLLKKLLDCIRLFYKNVNGVLFDSSLIHFSYKFKRLKYLFWQLEVDTISIIES